MNFVGNVPKRGHLYPGTDTGSDCPIGFLKTCQTGNLEFMYFKDYDIVSKPEKEKRVVQFKTFEQEFLSGNRKQETEYRFHPTFIRIPEELTYVAINEEFDPEKNLKLNYDNKNIYTGLTLININNPEELDSPSTQAYFEFYKHYETFLPNKSQHGNKLSEEEKRSFKFTDFYPFDATTDKDNSIDLGDIDSTILEDQNIGISVTDENKIDLDTNTPKFGCEIPIYVGKDKPLIFEFNQKKGIRNSSCMIMVLGTDNVVAFLEATKKEKINNYIKEIKKPVIRINTEHGIEEKILGVKNLQPIIYGPYRFYHSYGVHFLLSIKVNGHAEDGWDIDHWNLIEYYKNEHLA